MSAQPKQEIVDSPADTQRVMMAMPVNPLQYQQDQEFRERAARRKDPRSRLNAQATLDAAPRINVILEPTEADQRYGEAHLDADGYPRYPKWECTYNGLRLAYDVGVSIEMPVYIWEQYQHTRRRPAFRKAPGDAGQVFTREIPDAGGLYEPPAMGR